MCIYIDLRHLSGRVKVTTVAHLRAPKRRSRPSATRARANTTYRVLLCGVLSVRVRVCVSQGPSSAGGELRRVRDEGFHLVCWHGGLRDH